MIKVRIFIMLSLFLVTANSYAEEPKKTVLTKFNIDVGIGSYTLFASQEKYIENFYGGKAGYSIFMNGDFYNPKYPSVFYRLNYFQGWEFRLDNLLPMNYKTYALQLGKSLIDSSTGFNFLNLKGSLGLGYSYGLIRKEIPPSRFKYEYEEFHSPSISAGVDLALLLSRFVGITFFASANYNIRYHYLSYSNIGGKLSFGILK